MIKWKMITESVSRAFIKSLMHTCLHQPSSLY